MKLLITSCALVEFFGLLNVLAAGYHPTWESIESRPIPKWFDEAKFGIFLHWGAYSLPAYGAHTTESAYLWQYMRENRTDISDFLEKYYPKDFSYQSFAHSLQVQLYQPEYWAEVFQASGAKYVVVTAKHHEGFALWPSEHSWNWNANDIGPRRDLIGELATAIRTETELKFGVYYSQFEWYNPLYLKDKANGYQTQDYVLRKSQPELRDLVTAYEPDIVWSDGDSPASSTYWNSTHFLAWLYNDSPVKEFVVVNDRWGNDSACMHGGFWGCRNGQGKPGSHKWENVIKVDKKSYGYRREAKLSDFLTTKKLIDILAKTVSSGGNLLLNVGPTGDGIISPIFEERLRDLGKWLDINGKAIYNTSAWKTQNDDSNSNVWYTRQASGGNVYAIVLQWPGNGESLDLSAPKTKSKTVVKMLGYDQPLSWSPRHSEGGIKVRMPLLPPNEYPSLDAWVLEFQNLK